MQSESNNIRRYIIYIIGELFSIVTFILLIIISDGCHIMPEKLVLFQSCEWLQQLRYPVNFLSTKCASSIGIWFRLTAVKVDWRSAIVTLGVAGLLYTILQLPIFFTVLRNLFLRNFFFFGCSSRGQTICPPVLKQEELDTRKLSFHYSLT